MIVEELRQAETLYDKHAEFYIDFVDRALGNPANLWHVLLSKFREILADDLAGATACDIACGEGYLSRFLAKLGAAEVIGIDTSVKLIEAAKLRADGPNLTYRIDDAQELATFQDRSIDVAVSQMAIMDIPDHRSLFRSVHRVLRPRGVFVLSMLHPCFETPYRSPDESQYLIDDTGAFVARVARRYSTEGFWQSGGSGVRGHMGAYHRTLSTIVNDLLAAGFQLERLDEPVSGNGGLLAEVPAHLMISARSRAQA